MYTDLTTVKLFLGITDNSQDALLNLYLTQTTALLDTYLGDLRSGNKTLYISFCDFYNGYTIRLLTRNVTALVSINGTAYTGVLGTDYQILPPYNSVLYIKDFNEYNTNLQNLPKIPIVVTAGYISTDNEYRLLGYVQCLLIEGLYSKENGFDIQSYKLGDRSFTFAEKRKDDILSLNSLIDSTGLFTVFSVLPPL